MGSIQTKRLLNEVCNYLEINEFHIEFDMFTEKHSVCKKNPNFKDKNGKRISGEFMFKTVCEISVYKDGSDSLFIVWDKRINQPYRKSKNCVYVGSFGRYEFSDIESFYNHILSDFGDNWWECSEEEKKQYMNTEIEYWGIKDGVIE